MQRSHKDSLFRIIDANFNRAKEALRVCEDICRFIIDNPSLTRKYKNSRHRLTEIIKGLGFPQLINARDIISDVGKSSTAIEKKRKNINDVYYANSQRIKESLRVLEELSKIINKKYTEPLKGLRYKIYDLEAQVFKKM